MIKKLTLLALISTFPFLLFGQAEIVKNVEFTWIAGPDGSLTCEESSSKLLLLKQGQIDKITSELKVVQSTLTSAGGTGNLNIILRATEQLQANTAALNSFVKAAEAWETVILNPVTIVIDVDFGPTRFGTAYSSANVIGSTSSAIYAATSGSNATGSPVSFADFSERLASTHEGLSILYYATPSPINSDLGIISYPIATRPNLQALGYFVAETPEDTPFGQTPNIGFNSAFTFDFDQSNGISSNLTDFQGVTIHEIGHALGFVSSIGYSDNFCTTWDMFRFRPGTVKSFDDFATKDRVLTPGPLASGGDQVFWDGVKEYELSTGASNGTGGDTRQASHWRDDALRGTIPIAERKIGVMDPTFSRGEIGLISQADLRMLAVIGWNIDLGNLISPPLQFNAYSDYKTPQSMVIKWENPESFYDGRFISDSKLVLQRDGIDLKTYESPSPGEAIEFTESGLTSGQLYTYRIFAIHTPSGDTGVSAYFSRLAGGSSTPGISSEATAVNNGNTAIFTVKIPVLHDDGTPLHNLSGVKLYRSRDKVETITELSPTDTGKVIQIVDTAPIGAAFPTRYHFIFQGSGSFTTDGTPFITDVIRLGTPVTSLSETFETETPKVVGTAGWMISKADFMTSNAIGIQTFIPGQKAEAYVAAIKPAASQLISFKTIARLNGALTNGLVELSINNGSTWTTVKTLNSNSYADWTNGQNTWFKETISLADYAGKNVIIRFNLVSSGSEGSFGWFIDDILLETGTSVSGEEVVSVFSLEPNYPNPFNPSTKLSFSLPVQGKVTLKVMNILGQEMATLVDGIRPAGMNEVVFDAKGLPSGVYFYRISAAGQTLTRKMILSK